MRTGYYGGVDLTYVILVLPALLFTLWAQLHVKSTFKKYAKVASERNMSGADAARMVLNANGLGTVPIERVTGELTDHYDPKANVIRLSNSTYDARTAAAVGVAAHEAGHAAQYAAGYLPIRIRASIIPATNIGAKLSIPLLMAGLVLSGFSQVFLYLAYAGVLLYTLCAVFQIVTLPTEFDASRRALSSIERMGLLADGEELQGARKVLRAAALTYVAALATTLVQLLRFLILINDRKR